MGSGAWNTSSYATYCCSVGRSYDKSVGTFSDTYANSSQAFVSKGLDESLNPENVIRECCDNEEHPNTIPVILALDVTGSMGQTAIEVQKKLNPIMVELYKKIKDVEIAVMAIGDLAYDNSPIQISQFESDIRIAENLDKIYFENGGGGNNYESYTAAWYMGLKHCKLDCWKRGKKGLIITMGDEPLNPYLPSHPLNESTGDTVQDDVETKKLFAEASQKFDIYHICVKSRCYSDQSEQAKSFKKVLGDQRVMISDVDELQKKIVSIVEDFSGNCGFIEAPQTVCGESGEISW